MIGKTLLHYEILQKLGVGGMGEVYRARDTKLGREVALKVLAPGMARDPERRKRFQREAMAVAALKHPNIVTIYSVEEADGVLFITMELVEGLTLAHLVPPQGLNLIRLLDIAIPVADAVSYAHQKGITHRDLKPGNIMLDDAGRPKVLDFGLAKLLEAPSTPEGATVAADGSVTREGIVLGTASYMSPEQAEGKPTDGRSDIFSLGIILYEMATGQKPFKGDTTISTISSILKDTPPLVTELNRSLPNHMGRVVNRCLAKDPTRRYQVALDLRNELEGLREESSGIQASSAGDRTAMAPAPPPGPVPGPVPGAPAGPASAGAPPYPVSAAGQVPPSAAGQPPSSTMGQAPPAMPPSSHVSVPSAAADSGTGIGPGARRNRLPMILGVLGLIAVGVALGLWRPWTSLEKPGAPPEPPAASAKAPAASHRLMAVVFPFENLGPSDQAYFAAGVSEEITSRLAGVSGLGIISRTTATQYDRTGKTMKQIGEDLGVDYVLEGTVRWARTPEGEDRVRITPQLVRAADDTRVWSETFDRKIDDIFQVQSDIAVRVIKELDVTLLASEQERVEAPPTQNIEAYQAYLKALDFAAPTFSEWDRGRAQLLNQAVALDPKFLAAWYRLCRQHADQYRFMDRTEARLEKAKEALHGAEAVDPDDPLTRLARGYYYYYGFRDYDRALAEFSAVAKELPNDAEAQRSLGYILRRQGKLDESIQALEKAMELDPRNVEGLQNLAYNYGARRLWDKANTYLDRAIALDPDNDDLMNDRVLNTLAETGDPAEARRYLREEPGKIPFLFHTAWHEVHTAEKDWTNALQTAESIVGSDPMVSSARNFFIGYDKARLGDSRGSVEALETAARTLEQVAQTSPSNPVVRSTLGVVYAYLGRRDEAIREAKLAVDLTAKDAFDGPQDQERLAQVYALSGRMDEALDLVDRLLGMSYMTPVTPNRLRVQAGWEPFWGNPKFEEILARHEGLP